LKEKGIKEEEIAVGFLDETSSQLTANTVGVCSFGKIEMIKNTERMKSNTIVYAIKGKSVSSFFRKIKSFKYCKVFGREKRTKQRIQSHK
jgi:hypothetical protein